MSRKIFRGSELELSLILEKRIFLLYLFLLSVPNLIFSGEKFADSVHVMKWATVLVPFFVILFVIGYRLFCRWKEFGVDSFGLSLGVILFFCGTQYFFVKISSTSGFFQELLCLTFIWLFYIITSEYFPKFRLNAILWVANLNAALNVLIAELQTRGLYDLAFLEGTKFEFLLPLKDLIYRGFLGEDLNYMGNVGQHNMLGLWLAINAINAAYLFLTNAQRKKFFSALAALVMMSVNILGLLSGNSRSGLLSMGVGLLILGIIFVLRFGRIYKKYFAIIAVIFFVAASGLIFTHSQGINRMLDKVMNAEQFRTVAGRTGLWARSLDMLKLYPRGVGIGQYKWHFLEAQRERFKADPSERFRYTFWAHNEFIQFFCETGIIGGLMLLALLTFWLYRFVKLLSSRQEISAATAWSVAVVVIFLCNALWTRPFHRLEILVWLTFAFAVGNREIFPKHNFGAPKTLGLIFMSASIFGLVYLGGGIYGNLILQKAWNSKIREPKKAVQLFESASRYPFVREKARRDLALLNLDIGEKIQDLEACNKAFRLLYESFSREPNPNDLSTLLIWGEHFQDEKILREIMNYYKPGTYNLETTQAKDLQGNSIDILVIRVPKPENHD